MSGRGGASGHDAPMIAYDAILRCYKCSLLTIKPIIESTSLINTNHFIVDPSSRWEKLCRYGMFHGGDSDSTGIIAGACYGAMFGLEGVPLNNYSHLEYRDRLERLAELLYLKSQRGKKETLKEIPADREVDSSVAKEAIDTQSPNS